jgi:phosphoglycerol transferase MdoB-like AlkP superfamily enzyme
MQKSKSFSSWFFPFSLIMSVLIGLQLWRLLFVLHNSVGNYFAVVNASLRLDFSMASAFFMLCFIPYALFMLTGRNGFKIFLKWEAIVLWCIISIVDMSSIFLYPEWGTTLDMRAVSYLSNPREMWASVRSFIPWSVILSSFIITAVGIWWLSLIFIQWQKVQKRYFFSGMFLLFTGGFALILFRGGLQKVVITPSDAFFSMDMKENFAATNKMWYFLYSVKKSETLKTHFDNEAIVAFSKEYESTRCLKSDKDGLWKNKNIVLIILEGWSADMVAYLYAKESITPFFDSLSEHSLRFTNAFSTGFRTDQGLGSLLSGIPSMEGFNILQKLDKVKQFPSLPATMKALGKSTSFVYGGDLNFANLSNYLVALGFDTIIGQHEFEKNDISSDWGVPDHIVAQKAFDVINQYKTPFFTTWLLLSSHAPFDVPIPNKYTASTDNVGKYKSSVAYSDYALSLFFKKAVKQPWFENTVFIITSDHGSTHSGWAGVDDFKRFRIPMLVYNANFQKDEVADIDAPCNHFDLPWTIAALSGMDGTDFRFSHNIFCNTNGGSAFWCSDAVAGLYDGISHIEQPLNNTKNIKHPKPLLFLDMVKKWFNTL